MAIGYTPQTWVNGSAPALSAANLQTMDNGINAACDAVDTLIINDGTDNPGASTGAKIVSALTKAGYSLDPATGSDNLDNIADGSSYKRIAAAVATALNAGTYDAPKCTAFGIGGQAANMSVSLDNYTAGGLYRDNGTLTNSPFAPSESQVLVIPTDNQNYCTQIAFKTVVTAIPQLKIRVQHGVLWSQWYEIFNAYTDGNGGQPPAPKPKEYSSGTTVGEVHRLYSGANTDLKTPNISGGSSWRVTGITLQNTSTGGLNGFTSSPITNIYAGNTVVCLAAVGYTGYADFWRIA